MTSVSFPTLPIESDAVLSSCDGHLAAHWFVCVCFTSVRCEKMNASRCSIFSSCVLSVIAARSEERRVGKECRSRWSQYHYTISDYISGSGRMVLAAEVRKATASPADCYQYFFLPESGTANVRLHCPAVHCRQRRPTCEVDPNF